MRALRRRADPAGPTPGERVRAMLGPPPGERAGLPGSAAIALYRHAFHDCGDDECDEGQKLRELAEDEHAYVTAALASGFDHAAVWDALTVSQSPNRGSQHRDRS